MIYYDTHIHIDLLKNRKKSIDYINQNKIYCIAVSNLPTIFKHNKVNIKESRYIRHALGYHPELVGEYPNLFNYFSQYINDTRYIGEIGLDGSKKYAKSFKMQKFIFQNIVTLCNYSGNKILTVHSRKAEKEVLEILGRNFNGKVILHWYSGPISVASLAIERNYYFSINHHMIKTKNGRELIKRVPIEQLLIESDAPFTPFYSELDYFIVFNEVIENISKIKNIKVNIVEQYLANNFKDVLTNL